MPGWRPQLVELLGLPLSWFAKEKQKIDPRLDQPKSVKYIFKKVADTVFERLTALQNELGAIPLSLGRVSKRSDFD